MYILSKDIDSLSYEESKRRFSEYKEYLETIKGKLSFFPINFIFEEWYTDIASHKCIHDSWLDKVLISEDDENKVTITLKLLGAYHDGFITLKYSDVQYYKLNRNESSTIKSSHGDLRYEEFRLDEDGNQIHEFDWYTLDENAAFLIACRHIEYIWEEIPFDKKVKRKAEWKTN